MDFTVTRMNIDIAVNQSVQFSDDPNVEPGKSVNWTGRYSARTKDKSVDWMEATSKARPSGERFIRQLRGKEQGDDHSRGVLDLCLVHVGHSRNLQHIQRRQRNNRSDQHSVCVVCNHVC